jgi:RNA polymerase sigma-70 factor, ECF subfamily
MSSTAQAGSPAEAGTPLPEGNQVGGRKLNDLARAAQRGDPLSVHEFLGAVTPLVFTVCRSVLGREHPDLEDAIQDSLVDVTRGLPGFRFESEVRHYVTKIALRRAIAARAQARDRSKKIETMDPHDLPAMPVDDGVEARAGLLRNLLDDLKKDQANVLRLRLMLGHSIDEIAGMTGVSPNTVKTRLRLGKIQMRRRLERLGVGRRARR